MGLSTPGIGSGLDIKSMVDAYVKAEIMPLQAKQDKRLSSVNTELSAVGQLKGHLANLQAALSQLSDLDKIYSLSQSISDTNALSATLTSQAIKGSYQIEIQKLAQQQSLASASFANKTSNVGSGTLSIAFGTYSSDKTSFTPNASATTVSIAIAPGTDSLAAICDAINHSDSGVTASIVEDNQGARLTITSPQTGENYAMKITGIPSLNYDPTSGTSPLTETVASQNSVVKINGLTLTQNTNELQNAIAGVTLNLKKSDSGKTIALNITDNKPQLTSLVNDFIKKYNDSMTFLTNLTGYNATTKQSGVFQGDPQFRNLKFNLNKWTTTPLNQNNLSLKSLADIGIVTNDQGLLELNQTKYQKVLDNHYQDIGVLFAKTATTTDSGVRINKIDPQVQKGQYDIHVTELTPGTHLSGTIGNLPASSSDGITLNGSGELAGLSIQIISGSIGQRGQVIVNDGLAVSINQFLDSYMNANGDLSQRAEQLNKQVNQLNKAQTQIDSRSQGLQNRYEKQFAALDLLLSQLQSTSASLTQQLASLPSLKIKQ